MLVFGQNRPILSRTPTAPASRGRRIYCRGMTAVAADPEVFVRSFRVHPCTRHWRDVDAETTEIGTIKKKTHARKKTTRVWIGSLGGRCGCLPPPEPPKDPQNGSRNVPKNIPNGVLGGVLGASLVHLGAKTALGEASWRQDGASWGQNGPRRGQVGAKLGTNGAKLGPSWRQDASRRDPKGAKWSSRGPF